MKGLKTIKIISLIICIATLGVFTGSATKAIAADTVVIKFSTFMPEGTPPARAVKLACERIEKESNGEIKMQTYFGGNLLSFGDQVQGIANGVVDIGLAVQAMLDKNFSLNQVFSRPLEVTPPDNAGTTRAYQELIENVPALNDELAEKGLRWLAIQSLPPYNLHTTKKVVSKPKDVDGIKLEAQGGVEYWSSLGAAAMVLPPSDNYMALERGLVQGQVTHWALMNVYKTGELLKNHTIFGKGEGGIYCPAMGYFINLETWKGLSLDHRQILEDAFTFAANKTVEYDAVTIKEEKKKSKEQGDVFVQLTGKDLQPWIDAMKPLNNKWIGKMKGKGYPAQKTYDELLDLLQKYKN